MPRFDLPLEQLREYAPDVREPADFDEFWADTIADSRAAAREVVVTPVATPLTLVDLFDVTFSGFMGDPVKAWLAVPAGADGPLPAVVSYIGYNGGRGLAHEAVDWALAGYVLLTMDTRAQGGDTPDPHGSGPSFPGYMTQGIEDPEAYYYRRLMTDAVLAVDAARSLPQVDAARVSVVGTSQGGGLAIAAAGLSDSLVAATANVPFLCHFERAVGLTGAMPYAEIEEFLKRHRGLVEQAMTTLSYFDGVNLARRASAPALFSTALEDQTCPPSTVFAAFNRYGEHAAAAGVGPEKDIVVYPYNQHEGGQGYQWLRQAEWLARFVGVQAAPDWTDAVRHDVPRRDIDVVMAADDAREEYDPSPDSGAADGDRAAHR